MERKKNVFSKRLGVFEIRGREIYFCDRIFCSSLERKNKLRVLTKFRGNITIKMPCHSERSEDELLRTPSEKSECIKWMYSDPSRCSE